MPDGPFSGLLVVDLTRVLAGPFCTLTLAELGARVIKVENPDGGDDSRQFTPHWHNRSAYFLSLNRDKESIALDLKSKSDKELFWRLLRRADVLVENFRPGTLDRLGFGYEAVAAVNPRLVYASISGFGQTGPMSQKPAYDVIIQALAGLMSLTGIPGGRPTKTGTSIADLAAGLYCTIGIAAALYNRQRTGRGCRIDVAMLDSLLTLEESGVMRYMATGQVPEAMGNRHPSIAPFDTFSAADRDIVIAVGNDALFSRLCNALEINDLAQDERFRTNRQRVENHAELKQQLETVLRTQPGEHWVRILEAAGVPCGLVQTVKDALEMPQVQARQMIVEADGLRMVGNPMKISGFAQQSQRRPAPELNADGQRIRDELTAD